jgi:hypothetical protein
MSARGIPTPIPIFAPLDKPPLDGGPVLVGDAEDDVDEPVEAGIKRWNVGVDEVAIAVTAVPSTSPTDEQKLSTPVTMV